LQDYVIYQMTLLLDIILNNWQKKGKKYINMPYIVKGMDMSFSGLLSYCEDLILNNPILKKELE
jgi:tRNA A37 threonylcarbamoyltransferase TsaD